MPDDPNQNMNTGIVNTPEPVDWRPHVPADLKADATFAPMIEKMSEKDVGSLIKSHLHLTRKMGTALTLPGKNAQPEEVQAVKAKLYEAGLFPAPPSKPEEYGIAKPDTLPDGIAWSDELAGEFAKALHKHGAPKELAADLLPLYEKALTGVQETLKTNYEQGMAALKQEHAEHFDTRYEAAKRMLPAIFKTPEELAWAEGMGLGDHPGFLGLIMRLAPLALQDSSFLAQIARPGGEMTGEEVRAEVAKIMSDKTHPMHDGYLRQDKKVLEHIDELYRKAYGNAPVHIGGEGIGDRSVTV